MSTRQPLIPTSVVDGGAETRPNVAQTAAALAFQAAPAQELQPGHIYLRPTSDGGHEVIDLLNRQDHLANPVRKRGAVTLHDAASFIAYVARHKTPATVLYAAPEHGRILAVLNDHEGNDDGSGRAGFGDFRATLSLSPTKEWQHWTRQDGRLLHQTDFAEHIEQGLDEIAAPPAAEMLELAQRFEAHKNVAFKSVRLLADGSRQLQYEETVEAKAGQKGDVQIPREFTLGLAPYEGSERFEVTARLRYRIESERLLIGYVLVRPHKVLEASFADVVRQVAEATALPILRGSYGG